MCWANWFESLGRTVATKHIWKWMSLKVMSSDMRMRFLYIMSGDSFTIDHLEYHLSLWQVSLQQVIASQVCKCCQVCKRCQVCMQLLSSLHARAVKICKGEFMHRAKFATDSFSSTCMPHAGATRSRIRGGGWLMVSFRRPLEGLPGAPCKAQMYMKLEPLVLIYL